MLRKSISLALAIGACSPATATPDGGNDAGADVQTIDAGAEGGICESTCGENGDQPCCSVAAVSGGMFLRNYDGVEGGAGGDYLDDTHPATISPFKLDVYAVTVARFRQFVAAYPSNLPKDGDGKNPNNPDDPGWSSSWNALMPATATELSDGLYNTTTTCSADWKKGPNPAFDNAPMACATWYEAFAFCIVDGGRLPTSAEYNYAQAGGAEQRYYPWSNPPSSQTIDDTLTTYEATAFVNVGSTPAGNGKFGQADLSGDAYQWVLDTNPATDVEGPLPTTCKDCAAFDAGPNRLIRGASYMASGITARTVKTTSYPPTQRNFLVGFRCAHN
jgi:formylglycine-generating enzyme